MTKRGVFVQALIKTYVIATKAQRHKGIKKGYDLQIPKFSNYEL
jgi:hypothetical protein